MEQDYNYLNRYSSRNNKYKKNSKNSSTNRFNKIANQFIISALFVLIIIIISNFNSKYTNSIINNIKWVANENYNFSSITKFVGDKYNELKDKVDNIDNLSNNDIVDVSANYLQKIILPIDGKITSEYGNRENPLNKGEQEFHNGIDIDGQEGTPIKAALDGVVTKIDENSTFGRVIILKSNNGIETVYAHCSEILVDLNQTIKQGECIGKIGHTGNATSPHLHFELIINGINVDPLLYISKS